jgi:hypothetical protein
MSGIEDWLNGRGSGKPAIHDYDMIANSPISDGLQGQVMVAPAFGRYTDGYRYLPGVVTNDTCRNRIHDMVQAMEQKVTPDITIFDVPSGLNDFSEIIITRMDALVFLFAVDSRQTWAAYDLLLSRLKECATFGYFRQNFQIVASMIPETNQSKYMQRFVEDSWDLYLDNIYDPLEPGEDGYSFDLTHKDAPHYPMPIYWSRILQEFDPLIDDSIFKPSFDRMPFHGALSQFFAEAEGLPS